MCGSKYYKFKLLKYKFKDLRQLCMSCISITKVTQIYLLMSFCILGTCSYNTHQLAFDGNVLHSSRSATLECVWKQVDWHENCDALRHSEWRFHWPSQLEPRIQLRWFLPGTNFPIKYVYKYIFELIILVWNTTPLMCYFIADDQTCHHTIHCTTGNSLLKKAVQVFAYIRRNIYWLKLFIYNFVSSLKT